MTVIQLGERTGFRLLTGIEGLQNEVTHIYTCDLLSLVMGRARQGDAWVTVMGNVNSVAVAALADVACIVLAEGMNLDADALQRATEQDIAVLASKLAVYETARCIEDAMFS